MRFHRSTGLGVDVLHLLLDLESTLLTLVHGIGDGLLHLVLVELGDLLELSTALGILDGVGSNDTSQVHDLLVVLLLVGLHSLVKGSDLGSETLLGLLEGGLGIELGAAGGGSELLVHGILSLLVVSEGLVQAVGGGGEGVLGVGTVLLHLRLDLSHLGVELLGHLIHLVLGVGLVLGHQGLELLVLLEVLGIAVVTDLHHALKLSTDLGVQVRLLGLVGLNSGSELGHAGVQLVRLLLDNTRQVKDVSLERATELLHTVVGLLLGLSDVRHGLCETLVLESLGSVEGGVHTGRGVGQGLVSMVAVLGHGVAHLVELGRDLGAALLGLLVHVGHLVVEPVHGGLEILTGLLGVLLNLGSVRSNGL